MPRILVMIPSGEVYDHNCVRWYNYKNVENSINHYHNIGDAFVYDSSLKLLKFEKLRALTINEFRPEELDRLRAEFDYVVLRGSNYVNSTMDWRQSEKVLKHLGLPVLAFGIGAQAPVDGKIELSEASRNVLRCIADSTESLGVRGAYTAEVLSDIGIKNTRIVGCPTAFRRNDPDLKITLPRAADVRRVGLTIRREVSNGYAQDIQQYLTFHRDLIKSVAGRFEACLLAQGEVEEKKLVLGTAEQKEEAVVSLKNNGWVSKWYLDEEVERLYRTRLFYSDIVADYDAVVRQCDLVLGYRLHGNLMALANRVPSIYFTYDSRTREFAETLKIPSFDVFSGKVFRLSDYWEQSRFDAFNRAYRDAYCAMQQFLTENGVEHLMHTSEAKTEMQPRRRIIL